MIVFEEFVYISRKNFNLYVFLLRYSLVTPSSAANFDPFYYKLAAKQIIQGLRVD